MVAIVVCATSAHAQLHSIKTDNLRLLYNSATHSYLAPYTVQCFENTMKFHRALFDFKPSDRITILLHDMSDYADAGATVSPRNAVFIAIAPFSYAYETTPANERINMIMNHELVHVLMGDRASGWDRFYRTLFSGKVRETAENPLSILYSYLTTPRRNAPRWYHEGIAIFMETWMAGGLGRTQGAYDEMVFRSMVRDSARFYDPVGLESEGIKIEFHGGVNTYLYGTRFFGYLGLQYGPGKLLEWTDRPGGSKAYFGSQFKKTYGMSLDDAWSDWVEWEHQFQQANLDSIRLYPRTPYRNLSQRALGSVSRSFYDPDAGKIYAAVNYPGKVAHLASIDIETGDIEKLCDVKGPGMYFVTSLAHDPSTNTLFYTTDNYNWRDLRAINIDTKKSRTLIKDARTGDLTFCRADSSIWGVRHYNGISTLVRIEHPYTKWDQMYSFPYGKDIYDLDISPEGQLITSSLAEISGRQTLIMMNVSDLIAGDTSYVTLFDFGNSVPANFIFSPDSKYLFGSSYYTGVSNIFRYDFAADSMDAVTNCETGFFRPIPAWDDSLIIFRYTGKGFIPAIVPFEPLEDVSATTYLGNKIAEKHPIVRDWISDAPSSINLDSVITDSGSYRALANVRMTSAYPIVEGYKDFPAYGMRLEFSDPVMIHNSNVTVSYTPNSPLPRDERVHANWSYSYSDWELNAKYNGADFYDLFGPTKTSRKGNSLGLQYTKNLIYDPPRSMDYHFNITGYNNLERLPDYQNVSASFDKFLTFGFDLKYRNTTSSIGAVDTEKGIVWQLISGNTYVNDKVFPRAIANLDLGIPLPISHSSIWLRTSAGYSPGDRNEPWANFYFGGFGNNWVDHRDIKRYRLHHTFPGVEINEIAGTNYARATVEWTLPPLRFRRIGTPAFYWTSTRLNFFASGIVTNIQHEPTRREVGNVGAQMDFRIMMLSHLRLTFSLGYAVAFEEGRDTTDEFMFSLNLL